MDTLLRKANTYTQISLFSTNRNVENIFSKLNKLLGLMSKQVYIHINVKLLAYFAIKFYTEDYFYTKCFPYPHSSTQGQDKRHTPNYKCIFYKTTQTFKLLLFFFDGHYNEEDPPAPMPLHSPNHNINPEINLNKRCNCNPKYRISS